MGQEDNLTRFPYGNHPLLEGEGYYPLAYLGKYDRIKQL